MSRWWWKSSLAACGSALCLCMARWVWSWLFGRDVAAIYGGAGRWAVVTGGSDGIGRELALSLARCHLNLLLVSRTAAKLDRVAQSVRQEHGDAVRVLTLAVDVGAHPQAAAERVLEVVETERLCVSVLVNNVAVVADMPTMLEDESDDSITRQVLVNALFPALLTRRLIPVLKAATRTSDAGKRSLIVNVASLCGLAPMAMLATYSGTKAFVKQFSRSLAPELEADGVDVVCVIPGQVCTSMARIDAPSWDVPTPARFARAVVAALRPKARVVIPYWAHKLFAFAMRVGPEGVLGRAVLADSTKARQRMLLLQQGNSGP